MAGSGLGTDHFEKNDLDVMIPEIWSEKINDFFRADLKAANFFMDLSEDVSDGGDQINIPNITEMTAKSKSVGSQVELSSPTEDDVNLTIDIHQHVAFVIEDAISAQVKRSYNIQRLYAENAAYTTAATLEDDIFDLFSGFSNTVGDSGTELNDSNIRQAIAYLGANNVPEKDRAFFLHSNVIWNQVMGIDKFTLVQNTAGADPVLQGQVGLLYGIPVIESSRLSKSGGSREGALAHKSAIAFATANFSGATKQTVRVQADYILEYLGTLVVADIMYGVVENRDTSGVYIKASS